MVVLIETVGGSFLRLQLGGQGICQMRSASFFVVLFVLATIGKPPWAAAHDFHCKHSRSGTNRPHSVSITEFGAVGDGVTLNTKAFQNAIFYLNSFSDKGGAQLFVPSGKWLTGSFSLISHLTLSLDKDAIIIGSMDPYDWPIIDPLPSYGRGRELPGERHQSLIHGYNLTDVVITELMYSTGLVISNLTFKNSPFWTIHPVYSNQIFIQNITILAPLDSPNTDGIDPDSSSNVCIMDCYISTGDDLIVIKSGWDEYGISFAHPSSNISIKNIFGESKSGAGIAIGSEMSGGVSEVHAEEIHIFNSLHGIQIKTSSGRGGYVRNIYLSNVYLTNVEYAIRINGQYGEHPDDDYDPYALPEINNITIKDVHGVNISVAGLLEGIKGDIFSQICLSDISLNVTSEDSSWSCSYVEGYSYLVSPNSCQLLQQIPNDSSVCYSPVDNLTLYSGGNCSIRSYVTLASL